MGKNAIFSLNNAFVVLVLFSYGLGFYLSGALDGSDSLQALGDWMPYDSIEYVRRGEHLVLADLGLLDIAAGALNWLSLSILYRTLDDIGGWAPLGFVLINCMCVYAIAKLGLGVADANETSVPRGAGFYPILLFLASPFLFAWSLVPNKELLVTVGILGIMRALAARRLAVALLLTVVFGLVKVQFFFVAALFLGFRHFKRRKTVTLVCISLIYPILHGVMPGLQMAYFLDVNGNEIRSAEIFLEIDRLSSYPFGYIAIFFFRLVLNLLGGLNPNRLLEYDFGLDIIAPATSFVLGLLVVACIFSAIRRRQVRQIWESDSEQSFYLFCTLAVYLTLPFMQPRYYWWLIPILLSYLVQGSRAGTRASHAIPECSAKGAIS